MAGHSTSWWMDRIIWSLVYAGLFTLVVGLASREGSPLTAWLLGVLGGLAAAAGFFLIWVRSRLREQAAPADTNPEGKT